MAENTKIQWCCHTFNPWRGCTKISPGCTNCYAETLSHRNPGTLGIWGDKGTRVIAAESYWRQPLRWDREAKTAGERRRVFCASLADVFEDRPELVAPRARLWETIDRTPNLDWLLLTKRPENIAQMMPRVEHSGGEKVCRDCGDETDLDGVCRAIGACRPNVWLGTSVEDQARADERIPHLLRTPAAVRFLSVEPLLGPVDLTRWLNSRWQCSGCRSLFAGAYVDICHECGKVKYWSGSHPFNGRHRPANPLFPPQSGSGVDWVILGGESGPGARPCRVEWIRSLVRQCWAAGAPCFVKQLGSHVLIRNDEASDWLDECPQLGLVDGPPIQGELVRILGFRDRKGGDPAEWDADLRVREFPEVANA